MIPRNSRTENHKTARKNAVFFNGVQRKVEGGRTKLCTLFGYIGKKYILSVEKNEIRTIYFFVPQESYLANPNQYREQLILPTTEEVEKTLHDFLSNPEQPCEGLEKYDIKSKTVVDSTI
jgi:hypothetical protein